MTRKRYKAKRCPKCKGHNTYKTRANETVCRTCGQVLKIEKKGK